MTTKKKNFEDGEIAIYDDAIIYKRGDIWQMRLWLKEEKKYARFSLKTASESVAIDKAKRRYHELMTAQMQGKAYFSLTCKAGVDLYLMQRQTDVDAGLIVRGRYGTIKTHLGHWLNFIGKDTKLKDLERTDCENYYAERTKTKKGLQISQTTVENEQGTVNAMMSWLFKRNEVNFDAFDFKKLKPIDMGDEENRRDIFNDAELVAIGNAIDKCIGEGSGNLESVDVLSGVIANYYLAAAMLTGMRPGELRRLKWKCVEWFEKRTVEKDYSLVKIKVLGETSKVRKTRSFIVKDIEYFENLWNLAYKNYAKLKKANPGVKHFGEMLVFSCDGETELSKRQVYYHFEKLLELANIDGLDKRDLVPYSFRHTFITKRVNSRLSPQSVAEMCGTSVNELDRTYYHTTLEKMVSNAIADYYEKDGLLIPV